MITRYHIRFPLLAMGALALFAALDAGLVRLGWGLPLPNLDLLIAHGPLMVCGFLGTLICIERAVALDAWWGYAAPFLTGLGGMGLIINPASPLAALSITLGSAGLVALFVTFIRRQPALYTVCIGLGALVWLTGNSLWLAGWPLFAVVPWWMGFLLLTIAGERLELTRLLRPSRRSRVLFSVVLGILLGGIGLTGIGFATDQEFQLLTGAQGELLFVSPLFNLGERLAGVAMAGLAVWLLRYDIARQTVRHAGLPGFIAVCLLTGYVWLGASGLLRIGFGRVIGGLPYDAILHTFFLGFVFSMIFGHAPVIVPAVLKVPIGFRPAFYVHLILLHLTLLARVASDLASWSPGREWSGLLNALVLVFFFGNTGYGVRAAVVSGRRSTLRSEGRAAVTSG